MAKDILQYNGFEVEFSERQMVSLTQLWKMMGSPASQTPNKWKILPESKQLIAQITEELKGRKSSFDSQQVIQAKRGGNDPQTFAHYKLAIEYAGYLSVELKSIFLGWIKERIEENANPELAAKRGQDRAIAQWRKQGKSEDWIDARLKGIADRHTFTDTLKEHGITSGVEFAICTNAVYQPILGGTAKQIKADRNLPSKTSLREGMSRVELAAVQLAEILSGERMKEESANGLDHCRNITDKTSQAIASVIK